MDTTEKAPVDARPRWENRFANPGDADRGRARARFFMQRLAEDLPPPEREYLVTQEASILDWGSAFGDGVSALAEAFPRCRVTGLDFAEPAVAEARRSFPRHEFRHAPDGAIGGHYDVIAAVSCLEYFPDPLEAIRGHLRSCRSFYAAVVPYRETPLPYGHVSQFREECFPDRLEGFTRVAAKVLDGEFQQRRERHMLVVYASAAYLREREGRDLQIRERQKWDNYYATLPMLEIDGSMRDFGDDLAERIVELLPRGGKVLEAGCGAGWQSLALAQRGRFDVTLMDFSSEALAYAERTFAHYRLPAEFVGGDVFSIGEPKYDLVFNAGVLEHYSFDQQVAFLRGMASRSTKYVLALVPNRMCYWYWLWRTQHSARGGWPFGKEMPMADMSAAFEAAGLQFLGHWFGGSTWSEFFIKDVQGIDPRLREEILAVHRSLVVPVKQRAYLVAALGCKGAATAVSSAWDVSNDSGDFILDQLTASLADSLAATVAAEHRCRQSEATIAEKDKTITAREEACEALRKELQNNSDKAARELAELKRSRGYRMLSRLWAIRTRLAPRGGRIASAARSARRGARCAMKPRATLKRLAERGLRPPRLPLPSRIRNAAAKIRRGNNPDRPSTAEAEPFPLVPGLVSVVLPVYNQADLLRQAVKSVLAQSRRQLELIVVNDGSTDGAERVLAKYMGDPRVRVLMQPNQGLPKALEQRVRVRPG